MTALKTLKNDASVNDFINAVLNDTRRRDAQNLLTIFSECTGKQPAMWGDKIVGYGSYHYKSTHSTQEGDWPMTGFSPGKQHLTIYIMPGFDEYQDYLAKLGKYKSSVSCLYINKLADIDTTVLKQLITQSYNDMATNYECS